MPDARRHLVYLARRRGGGGGAPRFAPWQATDTLLPLEVRDVIAPGHSMAKLGFNMAAVSDDVWNWRQYVGHDDLVAITSDDVLPADRYCLFCGCVVEVDWRFDRDESGAVVAVGVTAHLREQYYLVYGRYMLTSGGDVEHFSGLPCSFNAGGRPNRSQNLSADVTGAPAAGIAEFTFDGAADARWWTMTRAIEYLLWRYNAEQGWLTNHVFTPGNPLAVEADPGDYDPAIDPVIQIDVDGQDLWSAIAAVADQGHYDAACDYTVEANGEITAAMRLTRRGAGTPQVFDHQAANADGTLPALDEAQTNLLAASVSETVASCVTAPVVAGGRDLVEITIELQKAWTPSDLSLGGGPIVPPGQEDAQATQTYAKRYVIGGADFAAYAAVMRLWDANTDGLFTDDLSLSVPDVAALADETAGSWPEMPYAARRLLSRAAHTTTGAGLEAMLEFTIDNGTNWYPLSGYKVLPGRLGAYLTAANLAAIVPPGGNAVTDNFVRKLIDAPTDVRVHLTCSIEGPRRAIADPARRNAAGTVFETSHWFDRAAAGQLRTRASSSVLIAAGLEADTADGAAELAAAAAYIQDLNESRFIEASLPLEWIAADVGLCDRVERIAGIEIDLGTQCGRARRHPRVVGRVFLLTAETYRTELLLDTPRKAAVL